MTAAARTPVALVTDHFDGLACGDLAPAAALLAPTFRFVGVDMSTGIGGYMALVEADRSLSCVRQRYVRSVQHVNDWTVLVDGRAGPMVVVVDGARIVTICAVVDWLQWLITETA